MNENELTKCIWCGKTEPEVTFDTIAHILPKALGGKETVPNVCDNCNHYFGTAPKGGIPCMDHAFKEIFGAMRMFSSNLSNTSYKKFTSTYFSYHHKDRLVKIRRNFNSRIITRQFKRALYEVFLQKYHLITGDGHNPMFQMVREFARYDKGNPHVYYAFNNIIVGPGDSYKESPYLPMSDILIEDIFKFGFFEFWLFGHSFFMEVLPTLAIVNTNRYLQDKANKTLIPIWNNERIYEFDDVMQIDFLMQRFSR